MNSRAGKDLVKSAKQLYVRLYKMKVLYNLGKRHVMDSPEAPTGGGCTIQNSGRVTSENIRKNKKGVFM